mmetsp:Transcript_96136/g.170607  ORF Transcript_96136/g.170607 Transcript_96136/m.170607 type:complete len:890 (+) Transcript_96136:45-2714(+)|eukprot:CAMPEP_0197654216 /NCGR_PEP_ID=MMETSP1338-20131121/38715_1 /TAXON_ID=43686 ORGANISM="Pelagodinium beii, Strain RCC1491" /NCGR_SAMPLE_ID=MMETSP1338 /ASSEMBLY_ACC=CAM_ASM_000754 /LENGTH=889 /DNA_ID=CAMNT_0043229617 /DNA_START=45 /DNA_END=2714 /DNA_ORIENTATION=-
MAPYSAEPKPPVAQANPTDATKLAHRPAVGAVGAETRKPVSGVERKPSAAGSEPQIPLVKAAPGDPKARVVKTSAPMRLPAQLRVGKGKPFPYGCSQLKQGLNFSIAAPDSLAAWLVLEVPDGCSLGCRLPGTKLKTVQLELREANRTSEVWHIQVLAAFPMEGLRFAWQIDPAVGPNGQPLPTAALVMDPCAKVLDSSGVDAWNRRSKMYAPMARIPDFRALNDFNWEGVRSPGYDLKDLIIYEAHVRSFTKNPDSELSNPKNAGTFLGFIEKIPHLLHLGINCVELLPVFEFDESVVPRKHPHTGQYLCQYWGYQTAAFYVPMQRMAANASTTLGAAIIEFKTLVRELHRHGIEVILDVVFNHTGEGAWGVSNWHSLSKIALRHYYIMSGKEHCNYTGCGNTVNANNPTCCEWICDCLRYWALEMHIDGFRFDLAAALTRGGDGKISMDPLFVKRLVNDPCLQHVHLIAEPWDCAWPDGYLVGIFPQCGPPRWAEWNGKYRDAVRQFIKGDEGMKQLFASRICGSEDLYKAGGRSPCHSINFVTAHDGFTLRDLVSYNKKQNGANNEESGEDNNDSWNCGETQGDDGKTSNPEILQLRERQMRNTMVALFLSVGTPMMLSGDEYGRTQHGNNNTWCQDDMNWFSWSECAKEEAGLLRFLRLLIGLRKQHNERFARTTFMDDKTITWNQVEWDNPYNFISYVLHDVEDQVSSRKSSADWTRQASAGSDGASSKSSTAKSVAPTHQRGTRLFVAFNAGHLAHEVNLPGGGWYRIVDTGLQSPADICESDGDATQIQGGTYTLTPYSCIVLRSFHDPIQALTYGNLEGEYKEAKLFQLQAVVKRRLEEQLQREYELFTEVQPVAEVPVDTPAMPAIGAAAKLQKPGAMGA